jgi:RNA polymerase sigma factor (sigma-70 family)
MRTGYGLVFARDRSLLIRFRDGQAKALEEIYWLHVDDVVRVARAALRACAGGTIGRVDELAADLSDVVQETFSKAFAPEARRRFDPERPFAPYLAQIARNLVVDHWRARQRQVPLDVDELIDKLSVETAGDDASWADFETVAIVERYLASLGIDERRVHHALYVKGLSQREAAIELGMGRQVVRTIEAKIRAGLVRELAEAGHREENTAKRHLETARTGRG